MNADERRYLITICPAKDFFSAAVLYEVTLRFSRLQTPGRTLPAHPARAGRLHRTGGKASVCAAQEQRQTGLAELPEEPETGCEAARHLRGEPLPYACAAVCLVPCPSGVFP